MKVSGFSFIKNAVKFDYPVAEAIKSILPICDEVVVAVGNSDDETLQLIKNIDPKIRIIETIWNEELKEGGRVLADETDKAFAAVAPDADWCFYIQGDEVIHEKYLDAVYNAMKKYKDDKKVDGLLFNYKHFYGSFDYVANSSKWYRNEIRVIKNEKKIYSYRDAQGFRKGENMKLNVKPVDAFIYHYGWVREPLAMQRKTNNFGRYWAGDTGADAPSQKNSGPYDYSNIDSLEIFRDTHPAVMHERIKRLNMKFEHDPTFNKLKLKDRFKNLIEKMTGKRPFDYKNYKII